jgi:hypothetical protein
MNREQQKNEFRWSARGENPLASNEYDIEANEATGLGKNANLKDEYEEYLENDLKQHESWERPTYAKLIAASQSADQALTTMITYNYEKTTGSEITPIDWTGHWPPLNLMSYDTFHSQKRAAMTKLTDGSLGFIANHFRRQMQTTKERYEMDKKEINQATGLMNEQGEYQEYRDRFVRRSFSFTETPTYAKLVAAGHRPVRALEIMIQYNYEEATGSEITPIDWTPTELMPRQNPMTGNDFASEKRQAISDIMNQRGNEILRKIQIIKEIKSKPWYHKDRSWGQFAKSFVKGTRKKYRRLRRSRRTRRSH